MLRYAARRVAAAVLVAFGVTLATFLLMHLEPGDPARAVLGIHATPTAVAALRREWGLTNSLPVQLGHFLSQLVRGDLGQSYIYGVPVSSLIGSHIGETAALVAVATAFAVIFTVPLAALAASRQNGCGRPRRPGRFGRRAGPARILVRHRAHRGLRGPPAPAACGRGRQRLRRVTSRLLCCPG